MIIERIYIAMQQSPKRMRELIQMETDAAGSVGMSLQRVRRNTLSDVLVRTRNRMPEKFALAYNEQRLNYTELDDSVNQMARVLLADGMKKGDMGVVMSKNSLDVAVVKVVLARIGAVMIQINYM